MNAGGPPPRGADEAADRPAPTAFMDVREAARYLHLNEKKVYALAAEGRLPGTKITGKWLFPRELVDQWLLESSHGGVLTDRLVLAGADDPLLARVMARVAAELAPRVSLARAAADTAAGLALLAAGRADGALVHWGPREESALRHPALLARHREHRGWVLVRVACREQGLAVRPALAGGEADLAGLLAGPLRWALRGEGSGTERYLREALAAAGAAALAPDNAVRALCARDALGLVATGRADATPACRAAATETGLAFVAAGWEALDLALPRRAYFRSVVQALLDALRASRAEADALGGYDLEEAGRLVWSPDA